MTRTMTAIALLAGLFATTMPAQAEIERVLRPCAGGLCGPTYRAKLAPPEGWVEDRQAGAREGMVILVPRGETEASANVQIFAEAAPKPGRTSFEAAMNQQIRAWRERDPSTTLAAVGPVARASGLPPFRLHRFDDSGAEKPSVGRVAWGVDRDRDGNAYLVVVNLTAQGKTLDPADETAFLALLRAW